MAGVYHYELLAEEAIAQVTMDRYINRVAMACPMLLTSWKLLQGGVRTIEWWQLFYGV
jgi:hypothetical protein